MRGAACQANIRGAAQRGQHVAALTPWACLLPCQVEALLASPDNVALLEELFCSRLEFGAQPLPASLRLVPPLLRGA